MLSPVDDTSAVVSLNPAEPFAPKPLIADILRTRYCIPGSIFLVEGVDASVPVGRKHRAVRLLLGDGELCIQSLLAPEAHFCVDLGQIHAGCYVKIQTFEARWMDAETEVFGGDVAGAGDGALGKQTASSSSRIVYLLLEDVETVGWNSVYLRMLKDHAEGPGVREALREALGREDGAQEEKEHPVARPDVSADASGPQRQIHGTSTDKIHDATESEYEGDSDFETMIISEEKILERGIGLAKDARPRPRPRPQPRPQQKPTQPLKLTPLRLIPNLPYKQNWVVNVLAIVVSVSKIEPSPLQPRIKRSVRLADMSTTKHVLLTVFLDPEDFCPKPGSAVLLKGVKNHLYDGGSLNKYATDRPKNHDNWWLENPDLEWYDVGALRSWWASSSTAG